VTDTVGRQVNFTYTSNRITQITDPIGRTIGFTYSAGGSADGPGHEQPDDDVHL